MSKPRLRPVAALSPREEVFVAAYCVRYNGTQAAIQAGYAKKSARGAAYDLLTKPHIRAAVARHLKARKARYAQTADNLRKEVALIAFSRLSDFYDPATGDLIHPQDLPDEAAAALCAIEQGLTSGLRGRKGQLRTREPVVKIKLHDKVEAQALLARLLGIDTGEDPTPTGPVFILPPGSEVNIE